MLMKTNYNSKNQHSDVSYNRNSRTRNPIVKELEDPPHHNLNLVTPLEPYLGSLYLHLCMW